MQPDKEADVPSSSADAHTNAPASTPPVPGAFSSQIVEQASVRSSDTTQDSPQESPNHGTGNAEERGWNLEFSPKHDGIKVQR
jgi:hypothetical protein